MSEITIGEQEHLTVKTPHGNITIYIGKHHRCITSFVDDTVMMGFYTKPTKKGTRKKCSKTGLSLAFLEAKE